MRRCRAYAIEPEVAFAQTTSRDIAVIVSGSLEGYRSRSTGTSRNPPPAPTSVPKVPTAVPSSTSQRSCGSSAASCGAVAALLRLAPLGSDRDVGMLAEIDAAAEVGRAVAQPISDSADAVKEVG